MANCANSGECQVAVFLGGWGGRATATKDDQQTLGSKAELLEEFKKVRAAIIAAVKNMTAEQFDAPGPENIRQVAPNVGALIELMVSHVALHIGQIQVLRRKLGKPVLF